MLEKLVSKRVWDSTKCDAPRIRRALDLAHKLKTYTLHGDRD